MSDREITPGDIYWLALPGPGIAHPHVAIGILNCAETVLACARSIYQSGGASPNSSVVSRP